MICGCDLNTYSGVISGVRLSVLTYKKPTRARILTQKIIRMNPQEMLITSKYMTFVTGKISLRIQPLDQKMGNS